MSRRRGRPSKAESRPTVFPISLSRVEREHLSGIAKAQQTTSRKLASSWVRDRIGVEWLRLQNKTRRTVARLPSPTLDERGYSANPEEVGSNPTNEPETEGYARVLGGIR